MSAEVTDEIEVIYPEQKPTVPVNWMAVFSAFLTAIVFNICVYHGSGGAGWAVFFLVATVLYLVGTFRKNSLSVSWLVAGMLIVLALRLVWLGTPVLAACGLLLLPALAMSCLGIIPHITDWWFFCLQSIVAGGHAFYQTISNLRIGDIKLSRVGCLSVLAPVLAISVFATIFVKANPDLASSFHLWVQNLELWINRVFIDWNISLYDVFIVFFTMWLVLGQLIPLMKVSLLDVVDHDPARGEFSGEGETYELYKPIRNTLLAVIALFVFYLVFEFRTLWFREFPVGFYYAGYAHKGAAWLTLALGVATVLLSAIFHGPLLKDPRLKRVKQLAWAWSVANLVLALAVYNRLFIYINFNGMTRMRVLGLFGITTVVVGFALVLWKIQRNKRFIWLLQRHLWTVAIALYALAITPVDYLVHSYNVRQILAGHLAPAVQITEHPVDASGWLVLQGLLDCEDKVIREGIQARLADFHYHGVPQRGTLQIKAEPHWTNYQIVRTQLTNDLKATPELWRPYRLHDDRRFAWERFRKYAYQWY